MRTVVLGCQRANGYYPKAGQPWARMMGSWVLVISLKSLLLVSVKIRWRCRLASDPGDGEQLAQPQSATPSLQTLVSVAGLLCAVNLFRRLPLPEFSAARHIRLSPCRLTRQRLCLIMYLSRSGVGLARLDLSPAAHLDTPALCLLLYWHHFQRGVGPAAPSLSLLSSQGGGEGSQFESRPSGICTQACHGHVPLVLTIVSISVCN